MNTIKPSSMAVPSGSFMAWIQDHWILAILALLAVLLILLMVVLPLISRLIRRGRNMVETTGLKKELMIWKNLASLVQGGEKGQAAKQTLSTQLNLIRILFLQGIGLLKEAHRKKYDVPWFMILGEPQSGKSSLLKNSNLELLCSAGREGEVAERSPLPLCCWLGAKSFVIDVAGRIFFDRWLEGSSAEWEWVIRLLNRFHHRRPLDGVILVIPADALLSDDETLTKQKASLIASELHQLLLRTGMNLPCHLVVSKMDMLLGFREYFARLTGEEREKIFGWQNPSAGGKFNAGAFQQYWTSITGKLRSGCLSLLTAPELFRNAEASESRLDVCGRIYLFPDSMESIRRNLEIYLNGIFGEEGWHGSEQALLSGVFFTSAEDRGLVLSDSFASLCGKRTEDAVLAGRPLGESRSFFIKLLLHDFIFPGGAAASFTSRELFKRQIPAYLLCLLIAGLGAGWLIAALFRSDSFCENLAPVAEYYRMTADQFSRGNIAKSPLVALDGKGKPVLLSEAEMVGNPRYTRLQFFYDAHSRAILPIRAPFGFKLAGFLDFGWDPNLGYAYRQYVFNQIQTEMVYLPTVRTVQAGLLTAAKEPFDRKKREAMFDFAEIVFSSKAEYRGFTPVSAFLLYLFPDISMDTVKLLSTYQRSYDWSSTDTAAKLIYDYGYAQAQKKWFDQFFDAWKKLAIYEETLYPQVRGILRSGVAFDQAQERIRTLAASLPASVSGSGTVLEKWHELLASQESDARQISGAIQRLAASGLHSLQDLNAGSSGEKDAKADGSLHAFNLARQAVLDYEKWLAEDKKELFEYIDSSTSLMAGRGENAFFQMERQTANSLFAVVQANLDKEFAQLRGQHELLRKKHLFNKIRRNGKEEVALVNDPGLMVIDVLSRLGEIAGKLKKSVPPDNIQGFQTAWQELNSRSQNISGEFDEFAKQYAEAPDVSSAVSAYRKLFQRQLEYNRFILASSLLKLYPKNNSEFSAVIGSQSTGRNVLELSPALAKESTGMIVVPNRYDPDAAMKFLEPYAQVLEFLKNKNGEKENSAFAKALVNLPAVENVLNEYLDDYLEFWSGCVNSLERKVKSWQEFRTLCATLKPYEVNTLLFTACKNSAEILSRIPEAILTEKQKKNRKTALAELNDKMQILNPHFSEICIRQLSAWSLLPAAPEQAFRQLGTVPRKELLSDYLAVIATGRKGDIPWWSSLFRQGAELLKKDAGKQILSALNKNSDIFSFPLCADPLHNRVLSFPELQEIQATLSTIGFSSGGKTSAPDGLPVSFRSLDLVGTMDRSEREWGMRLLEITDALANRNKPLVWTLSMPAAARRKKLNASFFPELPLASYRYRYAEVFVNGKRRTERIPADSVAAAVLARGEVSDADLEFRFFAFSGDTDPAAVLRFRDAWAVLRIYLMRGGYYDPEKKVLYAPLIIRDRYDASSVLWVALQFNKQLPQPSDWPSTQNWPDFSAVQKNARSLRVLSAASWSKLILEHKSYGSLKKTLLNYDLTRYPRLEVSVSSVPDKSGFFLRNRYAELVIPGQRPVRAALGPGNRFLGRVELTCPLLKLRFYRHADDTVPVEDVVIPGPYAPLHLLTSARRIWKDGVFQVEYEFPVKGGTGKMPLTLRLIE